MGISVLALRLPEQKRRDANEVGARRILLSCKQSKNRDSDGCKAVWTPCDRWEAWLDVLSSGFVSELKIWMNLTVASASK